MKEITSLSNSYIKSLEKLYDKKTRVDAGLYLVEGYHLINEAKAANVLKTVLITNADDGIDEVENIIVSKEIIKKLSKTKSPQNIIGICLMQKASPLQGNRVLILDDINDPGNLGTLLRTALGFNFFDIVLSENSVDLYNDKVIRSSQGAHFKLNIKYGNLMEIISELKANGFYIISTDLNTNNNLKDIKFNEKCALILGNEANGVSETIGNLSDINIKININKNLESLNVSIAGAIILHHINELVG